MARFVYTPANGEAQSWDWDPMRLMSPELDAIETKTGMAFRPWLLALDDYSVKAFKGLLWVMLKRDQPTLRWEDVPAFSVAEVDFDYSDDLAAVGEAPASDGDDAEAPKA